MPNIRTNNFTKFLKGFSASFLITIVSMLLIRLFEFFYISHAGFPVIETSAFLSGLNLDLFFLGFVNMVLILPLLFLSAFFPQIALVVYRIICLIVLFSTIALTHFFLTNFYLLSDEILFFSLKDILTIISSEISFNRIVLWGLYLLIPFVVLFQFYIFRNRHIQRNYVLGILIFLIGLSVSILNNITHFKKDAYLFTSRFDYYMGNNKIVYLSNCIYLSKLYASKAILNPKQISDHIKAFHEFHKHQYISEEYPLMRDDTIEDVLGPYFNISAKKPNIVIIISESLSSSFSGKYAHLANLTPFTDSLMRQGLYWRNFISNAERSYGALPNILASLPYGGQRGFMHLYSPNNTYPRHNSLINILKKNGYYSTFYYGSWGYYDYMGNFLDFNGIDRILSDNTFDKSRYDKTNGGNDQFYWGYNDKDLFKHVLENMDNIPANSPYLSIINTLSLHTPYNLCTKDYYDINYITKRLKALNLQVTNVVASFKNTPKEKIELLNPEAQFDEGIGNMLASIFFSDDALKDFFLQYSKRKDYKETIFIVTGDHNIGNLPLKNELDNFRVPLILFSPLLNQHKEFPAVSSHSDILPSLLALLNKKYALQIPKKYHWMGIGLDTFSIYRNRNIYPLSLYSQNFANFFCKDYLISSNHIFHVSKNLELEISSNKLINDSLLKIMENYKIVNNYVIAKNLITE